MANKTYYTDFFKFNRWLLMWGGFLLPQNCSTRERYFYRLYQFIVIIAHFVYLPAEILAMIHDRKDIFLLTQSLNVVSTQIGGYGKAFVLMFRGKEILRLVDFLEDEKFKYDDSTNFKPKEYFERSRKKGLIISVGFYSLVVLCLIFLFGHFFGSLLVLSINGQDIQNSTIYEKQPTRIIVPFEYATKLSYFWMLTLLLLGESIYVNDVTAGDALFLNTFNYFQYQLKVIECSFRTMKERSVELQNKCNYENKEPEKLDDLMQVQLKKTILHLQTVIRVSHRINGLLKYPILLQFLMSAVSLCNSLFLASTTPIKDKESSFYLLYMVAVYIQLFGCCWFGNEVTIQALRIPDAIWEEDWLSTPVPYQKSLILSMQRMQKPLSFTIGDFAPITLHSFVAIVKFSYSYFTILRQGANL